MAGKKQPPTGKLTPKQERFAQVFIETGIAVEAYRQVYGGEHYSRHALDAAAYRCTSHPRIAHRINELREAQLKKHSVTIERVVSEYRKLAFLDVRKIFDADGNLKPIHELDDDTAAAVAALEVEDATEARGRLRKVKLLDKIRALDSLAKYLKMFTDRIEVTGADGQALQSELTVKFVKPQ